MITTSTDPFAFQLEISSMLLDHHLAGLSADDLFWAPAPLHWTMHATDAGGRRPDWADTEPDPVPVPTVAWLSRHLWWWSSTLADVHGRPAPARADVGWQADPDQLRNALAAVRSAWSEVLASTPESDLDAASGYPWPAAAGRTRRDQFAWVTVEHTKNVAELGQLMLLRRAGR